MTVRLYCNVGWMRDYRGLRGTNDTIVGGGTHIDAHATGGEICNFAPHGGYVYGYAQPPKGRRADHEPRDIKLERLGADPDADRITGVTVIWTARKPRVGRVVVGWYNNATIYRDYQYFQGKVPPVHKKNGLDGYNVRARESDIKLLRVDHRIVPVPSREPDWFGQSNIWYADTERARKNANGLVRDVRALVRGTTRPAGARHGRGAMDQALKVKIEQAAIDRVWEYYEDLGYDVDTVEEQNLGWDLTAKLDATTLKIEVKGLTASDAAIELTPNETKVFYAGAPDYRLCVVRAPLGAGRLQIFYYDAHEDLFIDQVDGALYLDIRERTSVSLTAVSDG